MVARRPGADDEPHATSSRADRQRLRVRFRIDDVEPGDAWQVFLSNDGARFYSGTKVADDDGDVRVRRRTRNRRGPDRISASAVNARTGTTCQGSVSYRGGRLGTVVPL